LAYDELGDSYNEGPHLLVDYRDGDPFDAGAHGSVTSAGQFYSAQAVLPTGPDDPKRVRIFPQEFPDLREDLCAERKRRYEDLMKQNENRRR